MLEELGRALPIVIALFLVRFAVSYKMLEQDGSAVNSALAVIAVLLALGGSSSPVRSLRTISALLRNRSSGCVTGK